MSTERTIASAIGIRREVTRNAVTGDAWRVSRSAGGQVYLGKARNLIEARELAEADIRKGLRKAGDVKPR